jgi:hypothetical protein
VVPVMMMVMLPVMAMLTMERSGECGRPRADEPG